MTLILFPHQLFEEVLTRFPACKVALIEPALFFTQFRFHKQKLILHRASMKAFAERLAQAGFEVEYFDILGFPTLQSVAETMKSAKVTEVTHYDVTDDWLNREFHDSFSTFAKIETLESPQFLTDTPTIQSFFQGKRRFRMSEFYVFQRRRLKILVDEAGRPEGGKWSFDEENRKRLPKKIDLPETFQLPENRVVAEAKAWVEANFPENYGEASGFSYPTSHAEAAESLRNFLENSLARFGDFEDAISESEGRIFHSVLTPSLNTGLLTPAQVIEATLEHAKKHPIPLNSLEGFIRQIIGWREFVRAVYLLRGRAQRSKNGLGFKAKMPESMWRGTTGIAPVDVALNRALQTGYCHHIERLMIFGNFMLLCELSPDEVYMWFMTLFIDAYDWVMVPNVYGMSQYADGGLMTTKPYVSGSAYLKRMSDFKPGEWQPVWDGLYWRFISRHRSLFSGNQRVSFATISLDKMAPETLEKHLSNADSFLESFLSDSGEEK